MYFVAVRSPICVKHCDQTSRLSVSLISSLISFHRARRGASERAVRRVFLRASRDLRTLHIYKAMGYPAQGEECKLRNPSTASGAQSCPAPSREERETPVRVGAFVYDDVRHLDFAGEIRTGMSPLKPTFSLSESPSLPYANPYFDDTTEFPTHPLNCGTAYTLNARTRCELADEPAFSASTAHGHDQAQHGHTHGLPSVSTRAEEAPRSKTHAECDDPSHFIPSGPAYVPTYVINNGYKFVYARSVPLSHIVELSLGLQGTCADDIMPPQARTLLPKESVFSPLSATAQAVLARVEGRDQAVAMDSQVQTQRPSSHSSCAGPCHQTGASTATSDGHTALLSAEGGPLSLPACSPAPPALERPLSASEHVGLLDVATQEMISRENLVHFRRESIDYQ